MKEFRKCIAVIFGIYYSALYFPYLPFGSFCLALVCFAFGSIRFVAITLSFLSGEYISGWLFVCGFFLHIHAVSWCFDFDLRPWLRFFSMHLCHLPSPMLLLLLFFFLYVIFLFSIRSVHIFWSFVRSVAQPFVRLLVHSIVVSVSLFSAFHKLDVVIL